MVMNTFFATFIAIKSVFDFIAGRNNDTSISSSVTSGEVDSHTDGTNNLTAKKIDLKDKCPRKIKRKLMKSSSGSPFNKKPKTKTERTPTKNDESLPEEAIWIESPKELTFDRILGQGSFGKVILCKHEKLNRFYAVKQMFTTEDEDTIRCEKAAMNIGQSCWNKFIMELRGHFVDYDQRACLVMDFMEGGDLLTDLENNDGRFPEATARFYLSEIICGLEFLHLNGIVHRDLKFDNVLINREGHIKIADFGLSHYGTPFEEICDNEICGTDLYIAPEVILLEPYDSSCDWWSLGIMCYTMLSGMYPFDTGEQMGDLHFNIVHQDPFNLRSCVSRGDLSLHAAELCLHVRVNFPDKWQGTVRCSPPREERTVCNITVPSGSRRENIGIRYKNRNQVPW
ncbi:calcium-dependent protein kinase C-like [Montipora foliosa]|uniref:calcium-dependent protein kinase C-like n=1 Tax=Montipora foliosa TaxID=591990 RepID=UPI0035F114F3